MTLTDVASGLAGMPLFQAAAAVRARTVCEVDGRRHPLSPVAEGFLTVAPRGFERDLPVVFSALGWGRPVALVDDDGDLGRFAAVATESEYLTPDPEEDGGTPAAAFVVPPLFRRRRSNAIERRLRQLPAGSESPVQRVEAVGVGPWITRSDQQVRAALQDTSDVVMTDWTYAHTFPRIEGTEHITPHVVPYRFDDFDENIEIVDAALRGLQDKGVDRVGLLIEGNPDTYDVLDGLPVAGRDIRVTAGVPIGLLAVREVAPLFEGDPLGDAFVYFSGLHGRHRASAEHFLGELTCYLAAGVSCVLVEMFKGDVDLAVRAMELAGTPKTAVLLGDFFSESARLTYITTPSSTAAAHAARAARGSLSTMLITDRSLI